MCDEKNCKANCKTFKSVGTIHIRVGKTGKPEKLIFTPNGEHYASDGGKKYAVFLPTCKCTVGKAIPLCESLSVPISVGGFDISVLVAAAAQQTAVEIQVKFAGQENETPDLKTITIPAPCTKK